MQRLIIILACLLSQFQVQAQGYQISVQLKQYKGGQVYLAHHMGNSKYMSDSALLNEQGVAVIKGAQALPGGIYMILLPGKQRYFEILLDNKQQQFSIVADSSDLISKTIFKNSPENDLFQGYNKFLSNEIGPLNTKLQSAHTASDSAAVRTLETSLHKKLQDYRNDVIAKHPASLLSSMFKALKEPEIPTNPNPSDSTFAYRYYKAHYWDNIDLGDDRLVYTPILESKLQKYFTQLVPPHPDSVNIESDLLIAKTRKNKDVFKYVVWWLTYNYETSQYMGMDAVFVHLVEKYYVAGDAFWLNDEQLNKVISRAYSIAPNLIGQPAPPLEVKDTALKPISLYTTRAKYTVLVFWDPTCGHCKIEVPRLDSAYKASWKSKGVTMIGFRTEGTKDEWQNFIKEHKLNGWIHAWDPDSQSNFRRLYDVYSTPVVYLLDDKKKIVAKRLGVEQLNEFIDKMEARGGTAHK
jgi:peroxiredoxin